MADDENKKHLNSRNITEINRDQRHDLGDHYTHIKEALMHENQFPRVNKGSALICTKKITFSFMHSN